MATTTTTTSTNNPYPYQGGFGSTSLYAGNGALNAGAAYNSTARPSFASGVTQTNYNDWRDNQEEEEEEEEDYSSDEDRSTSSDSEDDDRRRRRRRRRRHKRRSSRSKRRDDDYSDEEDGVSDENSSSSSGGDDDEEHGRNRRRRSSSSRRRRHSNRKRMRRRRGRRDNDSSSSYSSDDSGGSHGGSSSDSEDDRRHSNHKRRRRGRSRRSRHRRRDGDDSDDDASSSHSSYSDDSGSSYSSYDSRYEDGEEEGEENGEGDYYEDLKGDMQGDVKLVFPSADEYGSFCVDMAMALASFVVKSLAGGTSTLGSREKAIVAFVQTIVGTTIPGDVNTNSGPVLKRIFKDLFKYVSADGTSESAVTTCVRFMNALQYVAASKIYPRAPALQIAYDIRYGEGTATVPYVFVDKSKSYYRDSPPSISIEVFLLTSVKEFLQQHVLVPTTTSPTDTKPKKNDSKWGASTGGTGGRNVQQQSPNNGIFMDIFGASSHAMMTSWLEMSIKKTLEAFAQRLTTAAQIMWARVDLRSSPYSVATQRFMGISIQAEEDRRSREAHLSKNIRGQLNDIAHKVSRNRKEVKSTLHGQKKDMAKMLQKTLKTTRRAQLQRAAKDIILRDEAERKKKRKRAATTAASASKKKKSKKKSSSSSSSKKKKSSSSSKKKKKKKKKKDDDDDLYREGKKIYLSSSSSEDEKKKKKKKSKKKKGSKKKVPKDSLRGSSSSSGDSSSSNASSSSSTSSGTSSGEDDSSDSTY